MKKRKLSFVLVLLLISSLISCKNKNPDIIPSEPPNTPTSNILSVNNNETNYNITTSFILNQDNSYGSFISVIDSPQDGEVILEAIPEDDCGFIGWSSDINGDKIASYYNPYKFIATEDVTLYPVFIKNDQLVELKNKNIHNEVSKTLEKSAFTYSDLQQITSLSTSNSANLEDLVYFQSLKTLSIFLSGNVNADILSIANLIYLEYITIMGSYTSKYSTDLLPIENYINLKSLSISYSGKNLSVLTNHKNTLEILHLYDLNTKDFEFLSELNKLKELRIIESSWFIGNDFKYIPESLESLDIVQCTNINNINNLKQMPNLKEFSLFGCWLDDITPISKLKSLETLSLQNNLISDISPLSNLNKLKFLYLENNRITDLNPIKSLFPQLSILDYTLNQITDYSFLKNAPYEIFNHEYSYDEMAQAVSVAKSMVENLIKPEMTDEEKYTALAIGLYERSISSGHVKSASNAYTALVLGLSLYGEGHADAYRLLCNIAGLPCYFVTARVQDLNHVWNIIKINGNYYHANVSWTHKDNQRYLNEYFLKSDAFILYHNEPSYISLARDLVCTDLSRDDDIELFFAP